ncbi:hypothetical protein TcCL_NonESM08354 [Trypanosoma cruzi]|nr:hypothetical protein TcCL_NonESM08354 [Trypanosoma cruzi]
MLLHKEKHTGKNEVTTTIDSSSNENKINLQEMAAKTKSHIDELVRERAELQEWVRESSLLNSRNGRHAIMHNNPRRMRRLRGGTRPPLLDTLPTMAYLH